MNFERTPNPGPRTPLHGVYGIADAGFRPERPFLEKVRGLLRGGAGVIQLRLKHEGAGEALALAKEAVGLCRAEGVLCLVNDRVDVALLAGADGAHLGADDLPLEAARQVGPALLLGATVRDLDQARAAEAAGADYLGFGPLFPTRTKRLEVAPRGLAQLAAVASGSAVPVVAIGGIDRARIAGVARAGAAMAAVVSAALGAEDIAGATRDLVQAFAGGRP